MLATGGQSVKEGAEKEGEAVEIAGRSGKEGGIMLFQHTINQVLSGAKTQTSRVWKDTWATSFVSSQSDAIRAIYVKRKDKQPFHRLQYEVGQELSVQPARGKAGVARIRITELAKRDVRLFGDEDIAREGFQWTHEFMEVWTQMHDAKHYKWGMIQYPEIGIMSGLHQRPAELYTALVIRFELLEESKVA